ncbi:NAD-dependent succinate-semialdehyde dehydrogenase [Stenoxybacter acetivorans]|uniref:NAD-dependent succinate-semialdehyde dehydrogenase n=1 Tax=Stenoxybacter acetivorans TaxID=422441 RepID=UPI000566E23D|nr:NAD-dependent succinate-semialdehyde dehydrogenase [Stenoxybacter acetivorans]
MAYQSINPYTQELLKTFANHSNADIENALAAAHALYQSAWSAPNNIQERLACLRRVSERLTQCKDEIARVITLEMGKRISEAADEVACCADIARYYADNSKQLLAPVVYPNVLGEAWVEHHPIGIVLAIEPWNFPLYQLIRVIAPAIAAGNSVVAKHASNVPQCAELMADIMREAGAPIGAYTNLFISTDQVADIIADNRVQGVALTGSEYAGSIVAGQAGSKLKKTTMELGGNDVFIVLDDADAEIAAQTAVGARLYNAGQVCTAAKRYIVQKNIAPEFTRMIQTAFQNMNMGDPLDSKTTLAPLSSARAKADLQAQLNRAVDHGAAVLCGNQEARGNFFTPTILTNISRDNPAYYEEFFGPVAQLYIVDNDDEAVALANDSHYGLGGTVFSGSIERAKQMASRIETGMVFINRSGDSVAELPFGGVKRSGFGRELSDLGIKEFVNQKLIVVGQ